MKMLLSLLFSFCYAADAYDDAKKFNESLKPFKKEMRIFSDGKGRYLATINNRFLWGDGKNFYLLKSENYAGSDQDYAVNLGKPTVFKDNKFTVDCGNEKIQYHELTENKKVQSLKDQAHFVPLPDVRNSMFLTEANGETVYITSSKYDFSVETVRVYMGKNGDLKEVRVKDCEHLLDGGTLNINTERGYFHFPPAKISNEPATFQPKGTTKKLELDVKNINEANEKEVGKKLFSELVDKPIHTPCDSLPSAKVGGPIKEGRH